MNARLPADMLQRPGAYPVQPQYGAICYRFDHGDLRILLITTRETGRWIVPKGWPIDGLKPAKTAEWEAWEEAGVVGSCEAQSIGRYTYLKRRPSKGNVLCAVELFPVRVESLAESFPERTERRRKWFSPKKAAARVHQKDLARVLLDFHCKLRDLSAMMS